MPATIIDGKSIAEGLRERIGQQVASFRNELDIKPCLAVVLVGDDPASHVYVRNKVIACEKAGMTSIKHSLEAATREDDVIALVRSLNADEGVDGILVQMPLPDHIDALKVISEIHPDKDVDGLTQISAGCVLLGQQGLVPCTPQGSVMLLKTVHESLSGMNAVVLGRSILVGKPLGLLLLEQNCTVTMAHSRTKDLPALCRSADIICAAVGRAELVRGDWVKPGATIIDVGINRVEREGKMRLVGDVHFDEVQAVAGAITPVPGGVGPMTIACLLRNTLIAACRRQGLQDPDV